MRRDLTHASTWGRTTAHATASGAVGRIAGRRVRIALVAVLAMLGALVLAAPASAFTRFWSFDGSRTPAGAMVPERMAVDQSTGDVYVIDALNHVVNHFSKYGAYIGQFTDADVPVTAVSGGTLAIGGGQDDVAFDNSGGATEGNIYVIGENGGNPGFITAFDRTGAFLWQAGGGFRFPGDICGAAVAPNGDLFVADQFQGIHQLSTVDGSPTGNIIAPHDDPCHIAIDSSSTLYDAIPEFVVNKYLGPPPYADPPAATIDNGPSIDVETDSSNDDVYVEHHDQVFVYDSTGAADPNSPFPGATGTLTLNGLGVNGPADRIYLSNADPSATNVEVWAHSTPTMNPVTVTVSGSGSGRVDVDHSNADNPPGISCTSSSGVCTDNYPADDSVVLTASVTSGVFAGWSGPDGAACGTATTCTVSTDAARSVTATFNPIQHTLTVRKIGTGSGTVTSSPAGIDCGSTCSALFDDGAVVTLTPTRSAGSTFAGWSGDCTGTGTCRVTMSADRAVTATFNTIPPPTVVTGGASGIGETTATVGGTVNPNGFSVTDCHIDYGTSTSYGSQAACSPTTGAGVSAVSVSASLSGLAANTDYHYRVVATNGGGTTNGSDATFRTAPVPIVVPLGCPQDPSRCPAGTLKVAKSAVTIKHGIGLLKVTCLGETGGFCRESLTFKATVKVKVKKGHRTVVKKKTIVVGKATVAFANGASGSISIKLTSAAKSALKRSALVARAAGLQGTAKFPKTKPARKKRKHKK